MTALKEILEKLKRSLGGTPAGSSAKADTASPAEEERPTNAEPAGASDEPWSGTPES